MPLLGEIIELPMIPRVDWCHFPLFLSSEVKPLSPMVFSSQLLEQEAEASNLIVLIWTCYYCLVFQKCIQELINHFTSHFLAFFSHSALHAVPPALLGQAGIPPPAFKLINIGFPFFYLGLCSSLSVFSGITEYHQTLYLPSLLQGIACICSGCIVPSLQ